MEIFSLSKDDFEHNADQVKSVVLGALVAEKVLEKDVADEWCLSHTIILRKKTFFQTFTDKWLQRNKDNGNYLLVVKLVNPPESIDDGEQVVAADS